LNQLAILIASLAASCSALAQVPDPARLGSSIKQSLDRNYAGLEIFYKDLHQHPELSFGETRTAAAIAAQMRTLGFEVTEKVGGTGVVAIFRNGDGPKVLVRTELDGLPMEEKTGLPYASSYKVQYLGKETPSAHSCGHDVHMAAWVGTAQNLLALKDRWKGTLMFVAQPAEETVNGAKAMLADGLFTRFGKPDFAFALHTSPTPVGWIGLRAGATSSNSDSFEITFKGRGGHGSAPHVTIDPIVIASRFVLDVQTLVSREKDPAEFGVVTVGAFQAGTVGNIIPDSAVLRGTIRSYSAAVREKILKGMPRVANASAALADAPAPDVKLTAGGDAIVNDAALVDRTEAIFKRAFGDAAVNRVPPITASEDFSDYLNQGVPGVMFFIGASDPKTVAASLKPGGPALPGNHSPFFAPVPEASIRNGSTAMTLAVLGVIGK
jgi:hippurate hydrolase